MISIRKMVESILSVKNVENDYIVNMKKKVENARNVKVLKYVSMIVINIDTRSVLKLKELDANII